MSTTIGKVAYIATWDATQLVKGVMTSRQQFGAQRKILESLKSPLDRYVTGLGNLQAIVAKYPDVARHQFKLEQDLERQYLKEAKAVRVLTDEETKRLKVLNYAAGERSPNKSTRRSSAELKAENDRINRERGQAEQARIQRLTANADKEAAIGRRALQDRLRIYKAEKAANKQRTRDEQLEFNRQMRNTEIAERKRARLLNTGAYGSRSAGRGVGGALGGALGGMGLAGGGLAARALPLLAGGTAAYAGKNFLQNSIQTHAAIQRNTAAMEVFTGSAEAASRVMDNLRTLSSESGVGFDGLQKSAATLMSFGISVKQTLPAMRQLTEITRGDSQRFEALALAYAQAGAAGKLMGQELLQMVNAGFNPLKEISRTTGIGITELRKEMELGNLSFDMVAKAFDSATSAGGKFHGMMEKIAETSAGSISRLGAEWSIFLDKFGQSVEPATKRVASSLTSSLSILSTVFSQWDDAVERRMDAAKKSGGQGANDRNLFGLQTSLAKAAIVNNDLDAKLAKYQEKNRKFEKMREPEKDAMAPKATAAGKSEIYDLQVQLGLIDKMAARRKELVDKGLNVIEIQRVMYMERQLELIEKQKTAWQKMQDDRKDQMDQMRERGKQLQKDLQSPLEAYRAELADLILLRRTGAIDQQTMMRGAMAAAGKLPGNDRQTRDAPSLSVMSSRSEDAYRFFAEMQARAVRPKEGDVREKMQMKLMADLNGLTREGNRILVAIRDGQTTVGSDG